MAVRSTSAGNRPKWWRQIAALYVEGFRGMRLGRTLWKILLLKLLILFGLLKPFFFQDYLATRFTSEDERADHVLAQLTRVPPETVFGPDCGVAQSPTSAHVQGVRFAFSFPSRLALEQESRFWLNTNRAGRVRLCSRWPVLPHQE